MIDFTTVLVQMGVASFVLGAALYFVWLTNNYKLFFACCLTFLGLMVIAYS
jgi:hypothetical protein|tara:strand:+ start:5624 stop:5776 length:153 start_codon:yes stop_codon:yes gene_type:complete